MSSDCLSLIDSTFPLYVASRNYYEEDEDQLEVVAQVEYIVSVGASLPTDVRESKSLKVFDLADDITSAGGRINFTLRHFQQRLNIYDEQKFDYKIDKVKLK